MIETINSIDWYILDFVQNNIKCTILDVIMPFITNLAANGEIWIVAAIALLFTKKYRKAGITILLAMLAGYIIGNLCLKNIFMRSRPCWIDTSISLLVKNPLDYSFPSGHTLCSVISATLLTIYNKKFGFIAIPLALAIAFSRIYLFVHYPSDVVFAIILGIAIAFCAYFISNKLQKHNIIQKA